MTAKRIISLVLTICIMLTVASFPVMAMTIATGTCGENLTWSLDDNGTLTISGTGAMWDYGNASLSPWFDQSLSVEKVNIGHGATTIGDYAFSSCSNLTSVTIGQGVTTIGERAFPDSTSCADVAVDGRNKYYSSQDGVLFNKSKTTLIKYPAGKTATSYTTPDSVTLIDSYAFFCCDSLTTINITRNVYTIGDYAFSSCSNLTSVTIPDGVTRIGYGAFSGCSSLTSVTIPDSATTIGSYAFGNCSSLTSIIVDEDNQNYSSQEGVLFNKDKTTLVQYPTDKTATTYTIPDSVTSIGGNAFSSCPNLTSVTIGQGITKIGDNVFSSCSNLASVTIGQGVTEIGDNAFGNCSSLTSIIVDEDNYNYASADGVLFNKAKTTLIFCPGGKLGDYTIPDGVTHISGRAFSSCASLKSITIPNSVTSIGYYAFYGCRSLKSITIPDSVTEICDNAFYYLSPSADVYYIGTKAQKDTIYIGSGNTNLLKATWHYFDGVCDTTCSHCSLTREAAEHTYDHACDTSCNECGATRTVADHNYDNDCDADCSECGATRTVADHKYDNDCDTDCNVCGEPRTTTHKYDNTCDGSCNICGVTRIIAHTYDNDCDIECNICGVTRTVGDHIYDNKYDADCNECGHTREVPRAPTFVVENKTAKVGDTFTVAVSTKNNSGITSLKLKLGYDADLLELISVEEADFASPSFSPLTKNPITVNWEDVLSPNNTTNGTIAVLTFKVKETATECDTEITITYDPEDVYDENFDNVEFAVENGTIAVIEYISGDVNSDGLVNNKDLGVLRRFLNDWDVTIDELASDVNRDGNVNNKDLGILRRYLNDWDVELK